MIKNSDLIKNKGEKYGIDDLLAIMERLRQPDGCHGTENRITIPYETILSRKPMRRPRRSTGKTERSFARSLEMSFCR